MDIIVKRFPVLAVNISKNLDNQSLVKFKESNRENVEFMIQNRSYWIRILKKYNVYFETSKESWKKSISNTPTEFIRQLAMAALHFFKTASEDVENFIEVTFHPWNDGTFYQELTPLHIAAYDGDIDFFYEVKKVTLDLNQCLKQSRIAPIHLAAYRGHLELCRQLLEDWIENKIPCAVLHYAAVAGHLEVYKLFHDIIEVKNPVLTKQERTPTDYIGKTPLHLAAEKGHSEICKFIIERVEVKNPPENYYGDTPLHFAAASGHLDICKFMLKNINSVDEKNPRGRKGETPLHMATIEGHLNICKLIMAHINDINPKNSVGKTPMDIAKERNQIYILQLFRLRDAIDNLRNNQFPEVPGSLHPNFRIRLAAIYKQN